MGICDKLSRHLYLLPYIYLNVDESWLTISMPQRVIYKYTKLTVMHINYTFINQHVCIVAFGFTYTII